ncbi:MAG: hypothetical protein LBU77_00130, partial [Clostridiales bacterium]|nr:hypothetical protein [Clostridiales bacterium]
MKKISITKRITAVAMALAMMLSMTSGTIFAEGERPMVIVDMLERTNPIMHGSAGFLYGVSSEGVPTTNLLTPLKPKVLATKGALGTEHPYGDALDVAKTFLESGGQMVQMYNSNYYAIFGPTVTSQEYATVLETVIAPAVVEWKKQWKEEHHADPVTGIDDLGLDIDKAIHYLPINEGTPNRGAGNGDQGFFNSWRMFYEAIKRADPKATVAGPNDALYGHWRGSGMRGFLTLCHENNVWPDIVTWHQLDNSESRFAAYPREFADYYDICADLGREPSQVVINEYAQFIDCAVPGRLVNFFANFEENQVYACLPFWHQANNLNDLGADANEPNAAWWLYKWYGDMSGDLLQVERRNTPLTGLNAVPTIDDNKRITTTLFGGVDGDAAVVLQNLDQTETFMGAEKVHVRVDATYFKSFNSMVEPETVIEGTFALEDGDLIMEMSGMKFSDAYQLVVTPAKETDTVGNPLTAAHHTIYEAEDAEKIGDVSQTGDGKYYLSNGQGVINFSTNGGIDYTIDVPVDGRYKIEFIYGNELGLNRGNEQQHKPQNQIQKLSIDGAAPVDILLKNTLERAWTGIYTEYLDLTAGEHTLAIRGNGNRSGNLLHDMLHVTYAGAFEQPLPVFDTIYQAEAADFNELMATTDTSVSTEAAIAGYTGSGYVTGLDENPVANGGGIRWNVVVSESGLYNVSFRYQAAEAGKLNVQIGNSARIFDGFTKSIDVAAGDDWALGRATIYLEKGVNIVDIDATSDVALDNMRVRKAGNAAALSQEIKAIDTIPEGAALTNVTYPVWDARNVGTVEAPIPELFSTTRSTNKTATTVLAPNGQNFEYVVGRSLTGAADAENDVNKYLEFDVEVDTAGTYAMQVFHSNDEIFGTHGYNTKIIDKFANIKVNDQPAARYFFINSIANDTFKEKTVLIELDAGENTIKIFNDDSWSNLKGLENSAGASGAGNPSRGFANNYYMDKPGNIPLVNSLPNLQKFIITPAALDAPLDDTVIEYQVEIRATNGGTAIADKNTVLNGESVKITLDPVIEINDVLVNGVSKKAALVAVGDRFELTLTDVGEDLQIEVLFAEDPSAVNENNPDSLIVNNDFGTGDLTGWT